MSSKKAEPEFIPIKASVQGLADAPIQGYPDLTARSGTNLRLMASLLKLVRVKGRALGKTLTSKILESSGLDSDAREFRGRAPVALRLPLHEAVKAAAAPTPQLAWSTVGGHAGDRMPTKFAKDYVAFQRALDKAGGPLTIVLEGKKFVVCPSFCQDAQVDLLQWEGRVHALVDISATRGSGWFEAHDVKGRKYVVRNYKWLPPAGRWVAFAGKGFNDDGVIYVNYVESLFRARAPEGELPLVRRRT